MAASLLRPLSRLGERVADLAAGLAAKVTGVTGMSNADRRRWAQARTLAEVGELTAQWLEGHIDSQPGYGGKVDVDEDDAPGLTGTLAALNRAGFMTTSSQAGFDGHDAAGVHWQQYAAVTGFATADTVGWLQHAADTNPGLHLTHCGRATSHAVDPVTWRDGEVATDFGNRMPARDIRDDWVGYGVCHPDAVDALVAAEQVVIRDTETGRNDRLWPVLRAAADPKAMAAEHTSDGSDTQGVRASADRTGIDEALDGHDATAATDTNDSADGG
jgi:hypothetical protein